MVWVRGGGFRMGSVGFYPEEQPVVEDEVAELLVDEHLVTNVEFRRFVKDTGWVTAAERPPSAADFPGADPEQLVPGSQGIYADTRAGAADGSLRGRAKPDGRGQFHAPGVELLGSPAGCRHEEDL